jgi:hypothetical protein
VARYLGARSFVHAADHSNRAATDALTPSVSVIGQTIWVACALALAFAFILISVNAMRVGLLTRFMGVLGIIVGVAVAPILPIDQQGIIRIFWLGAIGVLILDRWPTARPKAWASGEAEPWPTQQQLREQREAARAPDPKAEPAPKPARPGRTTGKAPPPSPPAPRRPDAAAAGTEHSASKKRKRKRRS